MYELKKNPKMQNAARKTQNATKRMRTITAEEVMSREKKRD
jgi:hypothetical protein